MQYIFVFPSIDLLLIFNNFVIYRWGLTHYINITRVTFSSGSCSCSCCSCWCWHGFQSLDISINQLDSLQLQFSIAAFEAAEWKQCFIYFFHSFNYARLSQFRSAHMALRIFKIHFIRRHLIAQFYNATVCCTVNVVTPSRLMVMEQTLNAFNN